MPAAADNVAARPDPKAKPGEVVGTLLDEVATGDGYVLRGDSGERYLVVALMFLDGATAIQLAILAKNTGARYSARGYLVARDGRDFDSARCVFVHRVAARKVQAVLTYP